MLVLVFMFGWMIKNFHAVSHDCRFSHILPIGDFVLGLINW